MLAMTNFAFVDAPLFNSSLFTLFSSVFDVANDLIFVAVLFDENRELLFIIAASFFGLVILFNACVCAYVTWRERKKFTHFAQWHQSVLAYASLVSFLSLSNCDALAVIGTGRTYKVKRTSKGGDPGVAKLFQAPVSADFERQLKLASWCGLVCDDLLFIERRARHLKLDICVKLLINY